MRTESLFRRRLLTAAAIVLMISSALLSFFFVQENDRYIAELKRSEEKMDQTIRTLWENASDADRHADTAVIVSLLSANDAPEAGELKRYYLGRANITLQQGSLLPVLKAADEARGHAVDTINDIYVNRLETENSIMARESKGKIIGDFAFLLQLMGLVLVILTREMHSL